MKIIGSDYDGTLNHNGIDDKKLNAIEKWRKAGNIFALISGRGSQDVLQIYEEQQFGCDYLIADNGAVIMKNDGIVVSDVRCDKDLIKPLLNLLFESGCVFGSVHAETAFIVCNEESVCRDGEYTQQNMPEVAYFTQISTMLDDFESAKEVTEIIRKIFGDKLNPLQNGRCIDIVRADMNKAKGLYLLMDIVGAEYDDVIAVGDNINDEDMIREFKSYAMENGVDSVKKLADYVTPGITELIEKEMTK